MPTLLARRAAVLAKVEVTEGVDVTPAPATDAMLVEQPLRITFNPNIIETTEVNPSLDPFAPIVGGMWAQIEFDCYIKGRNAGATASPEWAPLLAGCGYSRTVTAAAIPAAPEALAAGGTTKTAVLGATASTTAQAYIGMPINFTGAQTLSTFIWNYTAAKTASLTDSAAGALVATSNWQIPAHQLWAPASGAVSSLTIWIYMDGLLYKFVGCRGNVSFNIASGGPARMSFRYMGMFESKTDAALPSATIVYDLTRPSIWKGGSCTIDADLAAMNTFTLDTGNQLAQPGNPNALEGFDVAIITLRNMRGTMDPKETLVATRDLMSKFRAGTTGTLHAHFGTAGGTGVAFTVPRALFLNQTASQRNSYATVDVPFAATGQDQGAYLAIY